MSLKRYGCLLQMQAHLDFRLSWILAYACLAMSVRREVFDGSAVPAAYRTLIRSRQDKIINTEQSGDHVKSFCGGLPSRQSSDYIDMHKR
jgi:hypothetical protein